MNSTPVAADSVLTLREAIIRANASADLLDEITFAKDVKTIALASNLDVINGSVIITGIAPTS